MLNTEISAPHILYIYTHTHTQFVLKKYGKYTIVRTSIRYTEHTHNTHQNTSSSKSTHPNVYNVVNCIDSGLNFVFVYLFAFVCKKTIRSIFSEYPDVADKGKNKLLNKLNESIVNFFRRVINIVIIVDRKMLNDSLANVPKSSSICDVTFVRALEP